MIRAGTILLLLVAAGCSTGGQADDPSETQGASAAPHDLRVERISAGAPGQGFENPRVIAAPSAAALSAAIGASIPASGYGAYLAAYWGEKPTGGYSLGVESARIEGDRVTVQLLLEEPPPDAVVTQALTYPYSVVVLRDLDPRGKDFALLGREGRELDWPVRLVAGT